MTHVFDIQSLTKSYHAGDVLANQDISFHIEQGEVFGLLGDNGAGKSTLVKQMVNLLQPDSGRIKFLGKSIHSDPLGFLRQVSYMPQSCNILSHLTVGEVIFHTAYLLGLRHSVAREERDRLLNLLQMEHIGHRISGSLSGGERRLLQLAVALVGTLPVIILDEPTNELSPQRRILVWDTLRELNQRQGVTIILVTHDTLEAEKIVQRVGILQTGRLVAMGSPQELKQQLSQMFRLEFFCDPIVNPPALILKAKQVAIGHWVTHLPYSQLYHALDLLAQSQIVDFNLSSPSLEDIYIHYASNTT